MAHAPSAAVPGSTVPGSTVPGSTVPGGTVPATRTAVRTCPLCEAGCGLELTLAPDGATGREQVVRVRGDRDDVFSHGFLCPKGASIGHLHHDPDWLRAPVVRRSVDGGPDEFVEVTWDEAFAEIADRLLPVIAEHGRDAVAVYLGNPGAHSLAPLLHNRTLLRALGTRNRFSASTVDQRPKEISSALMFGSVTVPVPDLDRTDYLLMLGANPHASNGSLCTAPDFPGRLAAIRERGGRVVVVDPRRTETVDHADHHLAIRPGTDALFLAAVARHLLAIGPDLGRLLPHLDGLDRLPELLEPYDDERVAAACGIDADEIATVADDLAGTERAAVYGRIGTCTQEFGTTASWLVDVVNVLAGNLDRVGGAMFTTGAAGQPSTKGAPGSGRGFRMGRAHSRVSGTPETFGEFPVSVLTEEIETPGEGQVRALVTVAGNPVSSNPNSERLDRAIAGLDCVIAIDPYVNETTRHADVILPPPTPLQKGHYDLALLNFGVRNVANWSPPVLPLEASQMAEDEIMLRLAALVSGDDTDPDLAAMDDGVIGAMAASTARDEYGPAAGRSADEIVDALGERRGTERMLDLMLRSGPFGDGFGSRPGGLTLDLLEANPHGIDLGPLQEHRIPSILRTPSGKVELTPEVLVDDLFRLAEVLDRPVEPLVLIGRRHVRSNNSWMHNIRTLTKGRNRCTAQIHPDDAAARGIDDGAMVRVTSRVGSIEVPAEITDRVRPGVVSVPHGFGQDRDGVQLAIASDYAGANTNVVTDDEFADPVSGNIALNGVPIELTPA